MRVDITSNVDIAIFTLRASIHKIATVWKAQLVKNGVINNIFLVISRTHYCNFLFQHSTPPSEESVAEIKYQVKYQHKELKMIDKKDIEESIVILKGLKGYSERMGLFADNACDAICKNSECPEKACRLHYENSLKTAIDVMEHYLTLDG